MAVKYIAAQRCNPAKLNEALKWYPTATSSGEVILRTLSKYITLRSTVHQADTVAVLEALTQTLAEQLSEGKIVRLGDFGSFQVSIGGEGVEKAERCNASLIKSKKVIFRP
ncbi:MAG: HU family DNA-binding protein, partial [Prevotellaceae bacterium]|nr:HU family DNA-binding protein [Prevotellaceae bacterium]